MQAIAREMNCSETAFLLSPVADDNDIRVRYFTPTSEVPICGHATIAAHYVRATEVGAFAARSVRAKTGAGILPVDIEPVGRDFEVTMTQGAVEFAPPLRERQLGGFGETRRPRHYWGFGHRSSVVTPRLDRFYPR
jgi:PhzF family phenazine biosynthesis protein